MKIDQRAYKSKSRKERGKERKGRTSHQKSTNRSLKLERHLAKGGRCSLISPGLLSAGRSRNLHEAPRGKTPRSAERATELSHNSGFDSAY
jgi:hypothetical protein